jgi:hypothetical protein
MTNDGGLNLAGVETVLEMEATVERMRAEMEKLRKRTREMEAELNTELERLRKAAGSDLVPYGAYEPELGRAGESTHVSIKRSRKRTRRATD